jgi:hypothetical protein
MRLSLYLLISGLLFLSFSSVQKDISGKYVKPFNTGYINLDKNGSFFIQQIGGGTGAFETKGKWMLNSDTVLLSNIQNHIVGDPWKKKNFGLKFLYRRDSLISFSFTDQTLKLNFKEAYKRLKRK